MRLLLEISFRNLYYFFSQKNVRTFYRLVWKYGDRKRYTHAEIKFLSYKVRVPDCLSFIYQYREIFVDLSYRFKASNDHPVIIDCGSNIGLSVLFFKELYPNSEVISIEADPMIADILKENLRRNHIKDVEVINKAVWIHNDGVRFEQEGSDSGAVQEGLIANTPSIRLKDVLLNYNHIDFLKMDIEGAEQKVIPDCAEALDRVQCCFIEYHSAPNEAQNLSDILKLLEQKGFRYYLKNENNRKTPFINTAKDKLHDLQVNIYAIRER